MWVRSTAVITTCMVSLVSARFPIVPTYDKVVKGGLGEGFEVSLKQASLCETTPGVKSYSGYVKTPSSSFSPAGANSFFWFFESRKDAANAPLVIFIGGGPGFNSISSAVNDLGPCYINPDSNSTSLNPWSFNNEANLLFIDQPNMVGYSYDERVNATVTYNAPGGIIAVPETQAPLGMPNDIVALGTYPSLDVNKTSNSTGNAAQIFWEGFQTWTEAFPQYVPKNKKISLWTESYGGRYGPEFANLFYEKNKQIAAGQLCNATAFEFDNLGLINAWLDPVEHVKSYAAFAVNNTYGVKMVNETVLGVMQKNLTAPGGCLDLINDCQSVAISDTADSAANTTIDQACGLALQQCLVGVQGVPPAVSGLTIDDITQQSPGSLLTPYYLGFFQQGWVQEALGAAVNFTDNSQPILQAFSLTGDLVRKGQLEAVGTLLDAGVHVAIINGDRDYQINWLGGEAASINTPWSGKDQFKSAGYANITTNQTYVGGAVRQASRLSFARTFQAGHQGAAYQPETYFKVFDRAMKHRDLATGTLNMDDCNNCIWMSEGPPNVSDVRQAPGVPLEVAPLCYQLSARFTCTPEQLAQIGAGKAVFKDYVLQM